MNAYDVFAVTMVVTAILGLLLAWFYLQSARSQVQLAVKAVGRMVDQVQADQQLQAKLRQALAEKIRNLETYRVSHSNRLNEIEDVVSLLNEDAGRTPIDPSMVLQPFEVKIDDHPESELFDSSMSDVELYGALRAERVADERIVNKMMTAPIDARDDGWCDCGWSIDDENDHEDWCATRRHPDTTVVTDGSDDWVFGETDATYRERVRQARDKQARDKQARDKHIWRRT